MIPAQVKRSQVVQAQHSRVDALHRAGRHLEGRERTREACGDGVVGSPQHDQSCLWFLDLFSSGRCQGRESDVAQVLALLAKTHDGEEALQLDRVGLHANKQIVSPHCIRHNYKLL